jgi:hypothetical protein
VRFLVMLAVMPFRALAGYFAGQAALPAFRIAGSVVALRRDLSVPAEPYWNRESVRRITLAFLAVLAYQVAPMAASLVEQSVLRTGFSSTDSAGYYMVSRFSDFLHYLTFPLLLVMFPYTATAAQRGESTRPFVLKCAAVTLAAAAAMAAAYALFGNGLLALMPHGSDYAEYSRLMPWLVAITALTTCQVFYTNAEVSAGRFGFLRCGCGLGLGRRGRLGLGHSSVRLDSLGGLRGRIDRKGHAGQQRQQHAHQQEYRDRSFHSRRSSFRNTIGRTACPGVLLKNTRKQTE